MKHRYSFFISLLLLGCTNISEDIKTIKRYKLNIPQKEMINYIWSSRLCSSNNSHLYSIVFYVSNERCQSCYFSELVAYEKKNFDLLKMKGVKIIYIFASKGRNIECLMDEIINSRINGTVYIDTCKAFLNANPHIPDNELYHTFTINNDGKILMVGNPFHNDKMAKLFRKIIDGPTE